jgi:hypothetical protein
MAPKVVGGLYHLLNVGRIAKLSITGSRFQQGFEGHLIKTPGACHRHPLQLHSRRPARWRVL